MLYHWKKHLQPGEELVQSFGVGKGYLTFVLVFAIILLPVVVGLFILGRYFYLKYAFKYAFTNRRVIAKTGWFVTHLTSVDYDHITDIRVRQNLVDKLITKTGTLVINTAGRTHDEIVVNQVGHPEKKLHLLHHLIEKDETET